MGFILIYFGRITLQKQTQEIQEILLQKEKEIDLDSVLQQTENKPKRKVRRGYKALYLKKGVKRAIHIATTKMRNGDKNFIAIKEEDSDFSKVMLCEGVEILGESKLIQNLSCPLPNTNDRVVAYIETEAELEVLYKGKDEPQWEDAIMTVTGCGGIKIKLPIEETY